MTKTVRGAESLKTRGAVPPCVSLDALGADNTGVTAIDTVFAAALASLPTRTITTFGGTVVQNVPYGVLQFGVGDYLVAAPLPNLGPYVKVKGADRSATFINFYGTGACFTQQYVSGGAPTAGFENIVGWGGGITGLWIDGTNAGAGSKGILLGDIEEAEYDVVVANFTGANSKGIHQQNTVWWTEKIHGRAMLYNNTEGLTFGVNGSANQSHEYCDWDVTIYAFGQQNGVAVRGCYLNHGSLQARGNFHYSNSVGVYSALVMASGDHYPSLQGCHLDFMFEVSNPHSYTHQPTPLTLSTDAVITGYGIFDFQPSGAATWAASTVAASSGQVIFSGPIFGDSVLNGSNGSDMIDNLTYAASMTPNNLNGVFHKITVTNGSAMTINAPTSPPDGARTATITIQVKNSSGGAMGAITWNAVYLFAGFTWGNPANGLRRFARFIWTGGNWICVGVSTADY